jgi:hypothetical protein
VKATERVLAHRLGFMLGCRFLPEVNPLAAAIAGAGRVAPRRYMLVATISAGRMGRDVDRRGYALYHV